MIFIFKSFNESGLIKEEELITVEMNFQPCPVFEFRGESIVPHPEDPSYVKGSLGDVIGILRNRGCERIEEVKEVKIIALLDEMNEKHFKIIVNELSHYGFKVSVTLF